MAAIPKNILFCLDEIISNLEKNPGVKNYKIMINYCRQSLTNLQGSKRKIWFDNIQRIAAEHLCLGSGGVETIIEIKTVANV